MKRVLFLAIAALMAFSCQANADLVIYGVSDGDLLGGNPKSIILCATADIADLSIYGVGVANNGGGSDGQEFTFSGSALAGDKIIIAANVDSFDFFNDCLTGYSSLITNGVANINGDDSVELFQSGTVIDEFGDVAIDGSGSTWEYTDGYAVRTDLTTDGEFVESRWTVAFDFFEGTDEQFHKDTFASVYGLSAVPEPGSIAVLALAGGIGFLRRRR